MTEIELLARAMINRYGAEPAWAAVGCLNQMIDRGIACAFLREAQHRRSPFAVPSPRLRLEPIITAILPSRHTAPSAAI